MGVLNRTLLAAMAVAGVTLIGGAAQAASIGVNFCNNTGDGVTPVAAQAFIPTDSAGATAVAQSNWNNMTISNGDGNGHTNSGTLSTAVDSAGAIVSGFSVTAGGTSTTQTWAVTGSTGWAFTGGNVILESGQLQAAPTITITGIPYAAYDIYAYAGPSGGTSKTGMAALVANSAGTVDLNTYYWNFDWQNGNWVTSTSTNPAVPQGNLVVFANNTASNVTLKWDQPTNNWGGISGFQIVQAVPEPTSIGLLGLGSLALLGRRRARKA